MCPSARFYFSFCKHTQTREITGCLVPASILSEFSVSLLQPTHTSFEAAMWWKRAWYEERALFTYNHFHDWSRCVLSLFILHIIFTPQHKHQKMHGWPKFIITFKRIKYSLIDRNRIKLPASGFWLLTLTRFRSGATTSRSAVYGVPVSALCTTVCMCFFTSSIMQRWAQTKSI